MKANDETKPQAEKKLRLSLTSMADLCAESTKPDWLVKQVLAANQPMVIGGPPKAHKTSLALDMAVSLATGTKFLNTFAVPKECKVAVFSGESGRQAINETIQRICHSKDKDPKDCGLFCGFTLPQLGSAEDRKELRHLLRDNNVGVLIVDPLYLSMGGKPVAASNLYEVGPVLARFTDTCLRAGTTPIFVHHMVKSTSAKRTTVTLNDLAFAGIAEFARQWLLVNHRTEYQPGSGAHDLILSIGGSAGHSSGWSVHIDEGRDAENRRWSVRVRPNEGTALNSTRPKRSGLADANML
jgi:hypothetical protein